MSEELKACPFCGKNSLVEFKGNWNYVNCKMCDVTAPHLIWQRLRTENKIKAEAFIAGAEWQESAQAFDYDIGIDLQREKAANKYAGKLEGES